jgi:hypothetical protein
MWWWLARQEICSRESCERQINNWAIGTCCSPKPSSSRRLRGIPACDGRLPDQRADFVSRSDVDLRGRHDFAVPQPVIDQEVRHPDPGQIARRASNRHSRPTTDSQQGAKGLCNDPVRDHHFSGKRPVQYPWTVERIAAHLRRLEAWILCRCGPERPDRRNATPHSRHDRSCPGATLPARVCRVAKRQVGALLMQRTLGTCPANAGRVDRRLEPDRARIPCVDNRANRQSLPSSKAGILAVGTHAWC